MQSSHAWRVPSVGITDGDASGALSSIGIDFSRWNENGGLSSPNGAVFFMNPDDGPEREAVVAQPTVAAGSHGTMSAGMQGRRYENSHDWSQAGVEWSW